MEESVKINFAIKQNEDGYPPVENESLWANKSSAGYVLDNIPFFTNEATLGDTVSVTIDNYGNFWFDKNIANSSNSLIRIVFFDIEFKDRIRDYLNNMGCSTEFIEEYGVLSVDIPKNVIYDDVLEYVESQAKNGRIDYEEPIIRH